MIPVLAAEYLRGPGALQDISWDQALTRMTELYELCCWEPKEGAQTRTASCSRMPCL